MTKDSRDYILSALRDAEDHLAQYRAYAEAMCSIGRGHTPSSRVCPDDLVAVLAEAKRLLGAEPTGG